MGMMPASKYVAMAANFTVAEPEIAIYKKARVDKSNPGSCCLTI
jgi:hypothetical protein